MAWLIVATVSGGLYVDQAMAGIGQPLVNLVAWSVFGLLVWRSPPAARRALLTCLVYATLGEVFLSLVWGMYVYRLENIPLFVPPGHVLLFALGIWIAARMPLAITWLIPALAVPVVAWLAWQDADRHGPWLAAMFVACVLFGPAKRLYAVMFVLALAMELYGTWLGNWTWAPRDPWFGASMTNPPLAAGAFYCALDLLVTTTCRRLDAASRAQAPA